MVLQVPRQTVERWKKIRLEGHSSVTMDGDERTDDNAQDSGRENINISATRAPQDIDVTSQQADDFQEAEASMEQNVSDSLEISDSETSDIGSESGDSAGQNELNLSDGSFTSDGNSDFNGDSAESELDSNCGDANDPFEVNSLYPGCEKTKDEAVYELMRVYLGNKLSKTALKDILKLYVSSLPATNVMPPTVYLLLKYVHSLSLPLNEIEHYYCRPTKHSVASKFGPCVSCNSSDIGVFYEVPLENLIKFLFEPCRFN